MIKQVVFISLSKKEAAMDSYEFSLSGLGELKRAISEREDLRDVKEVVRRNGADMFKMSQSRVPVDTYTLKRSAKLSSEDDGMSVAVSYNTDYAAYQEYGTRFIPGKFYLKQAFDSASSTFLSDLERLFK